MSVGVRKSILRALVFAAAVVAVSLVLDLLFAVLYQGGPVQGRSKQFWIYRAALHGATFVLTTVGGAVGFAFLRSCAMTNARLVALGATLGLFTLVILLAAFRAGGFWGMAIWLLVGSAIVAFVGGRVLGSGEAHG